MALVSLTYYAGEYLGEEVATADFRKLDKRAEDVVLRLINKTEAEVLLLPEPLQTAVKNAICAQLEYLNEYGIGTATYGSTGGGFTVGKVTVQAGASGGTALGTIICPAVYAILERTGLLYPAVPVVGQPPFEWGWF